MGRPTILNTCRDGRGANVRLVVVVDAESRLKPVRHIEVEVESRDAMGDSSWRRDRSFDANDIVCQTLIQLAEKAGDL